MKILFGEKEMSFDAPISVFDAAKEAELVSRAHIAALVNGKLCAMNYVIDADATPNLPNALIIWKLSLKLLCPTVDTEAPIKNPHTIGINTLNTVITISQLMDEMLTLLPISENELLVIIFSSISIFSFSTSVVAYIFD